MIPPNFLIEADSDFARDLANCADLTELNGIVFPVLTLEGFPKTAEYASGQKLMDSYEARFAGRTFDCTVNTYKHPGGSSICLVENLVWKVPPFVDETWAEFALADATERGLRLRESFMPIFLVVSNRPTTLWGRHTDGNLIRTHHVLAAGDCRIQFFEGGVTMETPFEVGRSYEFDVSKPHNVVAYDNHIRVNLVTDLHQR